MGLWRKDDGWRISEVSPKVRETRVLSALPVTGITDKELLRTVDIGPERAVYQDPFYGVRALVDVAAQALSPAVNAPTTAVQVLDRLEDFLRLMATRPWPRGFFADETGVVRLVTAVRTWDQFVDLALTEIAEFGAGSPQVTRRLACLLDTLLAIVPDEHRPVLVRHQGLLAEAVDQRVAPPPNACRGRTSAPRPRLGIGWSGSAHARAAPMTASTARHGSHAGRPA